MIVRALPAILIFSITTFFAAGQTNTTGSFVPLVNLPGTAARLPGVKGVSVDAAGNAYFVGGGYRGYSVLRLDAGTGMVTSVAGNGTPGFSGDSGPATSAQLNGAIDLALDRAGNLYIADSLNGRIRKVSGGIITTVAGGGTDDPFCDNCPAISASLPELTGVAADSAGSLYIFTLGYVRKVSNGVITEFLGYATLYPDGADYTSGRAAVDAAGNLYVADFYFHKVHKVSGGVVTTVAGTGQAGFSGDNGPATSAQLDGPRGVAVDAAGSLYIADTGNQRIRKVSGGVITTVAGGGPTSGGLGDNGPATSALLNFPFGVGVDGAGNVFIEDTLDNRVRKVSNGVMTTVAGGGSSPVLLARSAGTFAATGSMITARLGHSATLLDNGKVLIAGGFNYSAYHDVAVTTAELYDPAAGTFSATGNMTAALAQPIATLLADGRVLITGGSGLDYGIAASAELYDASVGTFTDTGTPKSIAVPVTATLLNNGKVLVTGMLEVTLGLPPPYAAELYDPSEGTFSAAGSLRFPHSVPTATLLASGEVLIAEGMCGGVFGGEGGGSELYDPASGVFSIVAGTMGCRAEPTATLLTNGKVLIAGGLTRGADVNDPSTRTFSSISAEIDDPEYANAATLLPDATVLLTGGALSSPDDYDCPDTSVADAGLYDPSTRIFGLGGIMTTPRSSHQATLLADGRVLISGGEWLNNNDTALASAEIYTPPVPVPAPLLFSLSGDGRGQGAIWHADTGEIASSDNTAAAGDVLSMYTSGLIEDGAIPPQVAVGGKVAEILYFGDAPGYPGYFQVNFRVPNGVAPGLAVSVRLTYLSRPSNAVTIGVQQ